jgi:hypothetical protein
MYTETLHVYGYIPTIQPVTSVTQNNCMYYIQTDGVSGVATISRRCAVVGCLRKRLLTDLHITGLPSPRVLHVKYGIPDM